MFDMMGMMGKMKDLQEKMKVAQDNLKRGSGSGSSSIPGLGSSSTPGLFDFAQLSTACQYPW